MKFEGIIEKIMPEEIVGKKSMRKQTYCLRETKVVQYPEGIAVDFLEDDINKVKGVFKEGDKVIAHISTKFNIYKAEDKPERVFNTIKCRQMDHQPKDRIDNVKTKNMQGEELPF